MESATTTTVSSAAHDLYVIILCMAVKLGMSRTGNHVPYSFNFLRADSVPWFSRGEKSTSWYDTQQVTMVSTNVGTTSRTVFLASVLALEVDSY